jgi:hypothetical protein
MMSKVLQIMEKFLLHHIQYTTKNTKQLSNQVSEKRELFILTFMKSLFTFTELEKVPGPSYNPTDASLYRWKFEPKYSIAKKLKAKKNDLNPGPSSLPFDTNLYKHKQPIYSIREKLKSRKLEKTPGPMRYDVLKAENCIKFNSPAFSYPLKVNESKKQVKTPGPAAYDLRRYNPFANEPSYSMKTKNSEFTAVMIDPRDNC